MLSSCFFVGAPAFAEALAGKVAKIVRNKKSGPKDLLKVARAALICWKKQKINI